MVSAGPPPGVAPQSSTLNVYSELLALVNFQSKRAVALGYVFIERPWLRYLILGVFLHVKEAQSDLSTKIKKLIRPLALPKTGSKIRSSDTFDVGPPGDSRRGYNPFGWGISVWCTNYDVGLMNLVFGFRAGGYCGLGSSLRTSYSSSSLSLVSSSRGASSASGVCFCSRFRSSHVSLISSCSCCARWRNSCVLSSVMSSLSTKPSRQFTL